MSTMLFQLRLFYSLTRCEVSLYLERVSWVSRFNCNDTYGALKGTGAALKLTVNKEGNSDIEKCTH